VAFQPPFLSVAFRTPKQFALKVHKVIRLLIVIEQYRSQLITAILCFEISE